MHNGLLIGQSESIREALMKLDRTGKKVLLVVDGEERFLGTLTDGDIRRGFIAGKGLDDEIAPLYNHNPIYIRKCEFSIELVNRKLVQNKIELLPIVNEDNRVVAFKTWDQLFGDMGVDAELSGRLDVPVVIMAGGMGTRLDPFTRILPKPLIPVGSKPIVEWIIEEFARHGVRRYYLTVNHKSKMIESYFSGTPGEHQIEFVHEEEFTGTAGSLKLLPETIGEHFIVTNCDVIVRADYARVLEFHKERGAALTVLGSIQHHKIPYGVIEFRNDHEVVGILEKPEYTFTINTGVYVLSRECLDSIPAGHPYDMTELIGGLVAEGKRVAMYVVREEDYVDIGQWEEYRKSLDKLPSGAVN
jgi:dTDP-glucose pyrophosphorylase